MTVLPLAVSSGLGLGARLKEFWPLGVWGSPEVATFGWGWRISFEGINSFLKSAVLSLL